MDPQVRAHAVTVLRQKDDDELLYYLLQLVQVRLLSAPKSSFLSGIADAASTSHS